MADANVHRPPIHVPFFIRWPGPLVRGMLRIGLPLGPNVVLTVRGRKSGEPRPQPLALIEAGDLRYVIGTFGDVNWCRNLRANPDARLTRGGVTEDVRALELNHAHATQFFQSQLPAIEAQMPVVSRLLARFFIRMAAPDIRSDPAVAAARRPVFKLVSDKRKPPASLRAVVKT